MFEPGRQGRVGEGEPCRRDHLVLRDPCRKPCHGRVNPAVERVGREGEKGGWVFEIGYLLYFTGDSSPIPMRAVNHFYGGGGVPYNKKSTSAGEWFEK